MRIIAKARNVPGVGHRFDFVVAVGPREPSEITPRMDEKEGETGREGHVEDVATPRHLLKEKADTKSIIRTSSSRG